MDSAAVFRRELECDEFAHPRAGLRVVKGSLKGAPSPRAGGCPNLLSHHHMTFRIDEFDFENGFKCVGRPAERHRARDGVADCGLFDEDWRQQVNFVASRESMIQNDAFAAEGGNWRAVEFKPNSLNRGELRERKDDLRESRPHGEGTGSGGKRGIEVCCRDAIYDSETQQLAVRGDRARKSRGFLKRNRTL